MFSTKSENGSCRGLGIEEGWDNECEGLLYFTNCLAILPKLMSMIWNFGCLTPKL